MPGLGILRLPRVHDTATTNLLGGAVLAPHRLPAPVQPRDLLLQRLVLRPQRVNTRHLAPLAGCLQGRGQAVTLLFFKGCLLYTSDAADE